MKLKPGSNSNKLLSMTRSEAKMYEYEVPEENRIHRHINKEKIKDLYILTIALLGDYSAEFYNNNDNEKDSLKELKDNLVFSAQFFDAYFNAKLQDENRDYYIIMGSAAYYLCDYMGSAKVLSNKLISDELNLDVNKLDLLLLSFLKNDFSIKIQESVYIKFINNIISSLDGYVVLHKLLYNNLEICDIFGYKQEDLYLYFVKDGFKGTIRDLSYQIYNTAKLIENSINTDCKFLSDFYDKYKETFKSHFITAEEFINLFKTRTLKYVFAFRDKNNRSLKDNPSVFQSNVAKFALVDLEEKMKQLNKSELKILQIKNIGS